MYNKCVTLSLGQSISSFADQCNIDLSTNVTFCPGSDPVQCVSVGIRGDDIVEGTEQFAVVFSSDDGHVVITDNTTIVSVIDDDGNQEHLLLKVLYPVDMLNKLSTKEFEISYHRSPRPVPVFSKLCNRLGHNTVFKALLSHLLLAIRQCYI